MSYTRREFGKLALAGLPAAAVLGTTPTPSSAPSRRRSRTRLINGVQVGTITYSFRSMPDQSAEATLKYILDSGISAIEMMGGPVESFAGAPAAAGRGGGAGGGRRGGPGGGRGRPAAVARRPSPPPGAQDGRLERRAVRDSPRGRRPAAVAAAGRGGGAPAAGRADAAAAGGAAGAGDEAEGVAHVGLDGQVQGAAQDVQRRGRDDLRLEAAQPEHVGRGVRVHLQRRRSARLHAHDARAADRERRAAEADRRLRDEEEDLRRVPHPRAGQHDRRSTRRSRCRRATWRTSTSATTSPAATSAARRCSS